MKRLELNFCFGFSLFVLSNDYYCVKSYLHGTVNRTHPHHHICVSCFAHISKVFYLNLLTLFPEYDAHVICETTLHNTETALLTDLSWSLLHPKCSQSFYL